MPLRASLDYTAGITRSRGTVKIKPSLYAAIALGVGIVIALGLGCGSGWGWAACVDRGLTIYPPIGGGEFLLSEVASLVVVLGGIFFSLIAYANGEQRRVRVSVVFLMLFIATYIGENNMMRDDLRSQFLMVLLIWVGVELLLRRRYLPIVLLGLGCGVAFIGSLGDNTMQIQFEGVFGMTIAESALAPLQRIFGAHEESLEVIGWGFFLAAAVRALDIRFIQTQSAVFFVLIAGAVLAITIGNTFLQAADNDTFEGARKFGLFCSLAGVAFVCASVFVSYPVGYPRIHCATLTLAAYMLFVFSPTTHAHQHSATISSWTWIVPLLALHYYLVTRRRSAPAAQTGQAGNPSNAAGDARRHE